ncbi:hypothetical protein TorRG33x02_174340 [Trema orientale]|uniref:Transmembrane protein n=1 Tax=Trema orientale TaxID=63057 RepID=A0A2P5EMT6_TREOI|nr:hypothetical protein TorRG33x02_174340 [Trema orientale]
MSVLFSRWLTPLRLRELKTIRICNTITNRPANNLSPPLNKDMKFFVGFYSMFLKTKLYMVTKFLFFIFKNENRKASLGNRPCPQHPKREEKGERKLREETAIEEGKGVEKSQTTPKVVGGVEGHQRG